MTAVPLKGELMRFRHERIRLRPFPEEVAPCGTAGLQPVYIRRAFGKPTPDLSDCLARKAIDRPWFLVIWEPLPTKSPGPNLAQPYCCYIQTVIFYHRPHIVDPFTRLYRGANGRLHASKGGGSFVEWDKLETRLTWDDLVGFQGEVFKIDGGTVVWRKRRWWVLRRARREKGEGS